MVALTEHRPVPLPAFWRLCSSRDQHAVCLHWPSIVLQHDAKVMGGHALVSSCRLCMHSVAHGDVHLCSFAAVCVRGLGNLKILYILVLVSS